MRCLASFSIFIYGEGEEGEEGEYELLLLFLITLRWGLSTAGPFRRFQPGSRWWRSRRRRRSRTTSASGCRLSLRISSVYHQDPAALFKVKIKINICKNEQNFGIFFYLRRPATRSGSPCRKCSRPWRCTCRCRRPWSCASWATPRRRPVSSRRDRFPPTPCPNRIEGNSVGYTFRSVVKRRIEAPNYRANERENWKGIFFLFLPQPNCPRGGRIREWTMVITDGKGGQNRSQCISLPTTREVNIVQFQKIQNKIWFF